MELVAFITALAIAAGGHPATVSCNPDLLATEGGITYRATHRIEVGPQSCGGLLLLLASTRDRARIMEASNLSASEAELRMGEGILVIAHEAQHSAGILDESEAECRAIRLVPQLLAPYLSGQLLRDVVSEAVLVHQSAPPNYRRVC